MIDPVGAEHRALVARFSRTEARAGIDAIFAIEREVLQSAASHLDHTVAHARLAYWDEELRRLAAGVPTHPLALTLVRCAADLGLAPPDLAPLVGIAQVMLAQAQFDTRKEIEAVFVAWGRSVFATVTNFEAAAAALARGVATPSTSRRARSVALQLGALVHEMDWLSQGTATDDTEPLERLRMLRTSTRSIVRRLDADGLRDCAGSIAWCSLVVAYSDAHCAASSHGRFAPLRRTIAAWRAAVACRRGQIPTALTEQS